MGIFVKYCVIKRDGDKEVARKDTYEEAHQEIERRLPGDLMGDVDYYILKIWTNSDKVK
jgi:hypothetical protein